MDGTLNLEQKITRIVITGGPCAGKTTAMSWIQNAFTKKGYLVLFVDETATQLMTGGALWKYNRNAPSAYVPKEMEAALREALPDCHINTTSDPSQGGWRDPGTRYETISEMFKYRDSVYIPFTNFD